MKKQLSKAHIQYIKRIRRTNIMVWFSRAAILVLFFCAWEFLSSKNIIDGFLFSSPSRMVKTLYSLFKSGELMKHIGITLYETLLGFILAVAIGTVTALAFWWFEKLRRIMEPYIVVLNCLPKIALGPIIIVWFGAGAKAIIFMTFIISVIIVTITMMNGFSQVDENKVFLMKTMGANRLQILTKLVLPSSVPTFIGMLKICIGMAWIGSIMGEYLSSRAGLGYLIVYGGQVFKLDLVMASTLVLCLLAGGMYALVSLIERKLVNR